MPSASSLAEQGLKAFNAGNYSEAIDYYSQALSANPEVPDYYLKRSTAYQRTSQPELALHDADLAVMLANKRGKREMVGSAQLRRGIALHLLGRHGDARFCIAEAEKRCTGKELNMVAMWSKKLEAVMEKLDDDDVAREVTIPQVPAVDVPGASQKITELESEVPAAKPVISPPPPAPAGVVTPAGKIRHEWYQTPNNVVLTLYVKGVPKDQAAVEINEKTVDREVPATELASANVS